MRTFTRYLRSCLHKSRSFREFSGAQGNVENGGQLWGSSSFNSLSQLSGLAMSLGIFLSVSSMLGFQSFYKDSGGQTQSLGHAQQVLCWTDAIIYSAPTSIIFFETSPSQKTIRLQMKR